MGLAYLIFTNQLGWAMRGQWGSTYSSPNGYLWDCLWNPSASLGTPRVKTLTRMGLYSAALPSIAVRSGSGFQGSSNRTLEQGFLNVFPLAQRALAVSSPASLSS